MSRWKLIVQLALVVLSFALLNFKTHALEETPENKPQSITIIKNDSRVTESRYLINPGDVLAFSMYGEPDLTQPEIKVRPDGYATIEPIGEVFAANKTIQDLTAEVYESMSVYFKAPQISLNVKRFNPASIYVYGAVKKPGFYQQNIETPTIWNDPKTVNAKTDLSLTNVISLAGGVNFDADLAHILVSNKQTGYSKELDLWKLINDGDTKQNIKLVSGDSVYIPELKGQIYNDDQFQQIANSALHSEDFIVRVMGEVNNPGLYKIPSESPTLNSAITMASGYAISAKRHYVQVLRKTPQGNLASINVNPSKLDYVLRPDDIVFVRDRYLMKLVRTSDYVSRIFGGFSAPASSFNEWADAFKPKRRYGY